MKAKKEKEESKCRDRAENLEDLLARNKEWAEETKKVNPGFLESLASGQDPKFLFIGCSDSRVPPNTITNTQPNELFVHRNVANMVLSTDLNLLTVMSYAVEVLKIPNIIVCGHYDCGGVRASLQEHDHGLVAHWVTNIRNVSRLHQEDLSKIEDHEAKVRRLVELNVVEQCLNISKIGFIQKMQKKTASDLENPHPYPIPRVHGVVYDPVDGILKKLDIDETWSKEKASLSPIFSLYGQ